MALLERFPRHFSGLDLINRPTNKVMSQSEKLAAEYDFRLVKRHLPKSPVEMFGANVGDPVILARLKNGRKFGILERDAFDTSDEFGFDANHYSWDPDRDAVNGEFIYRFSIHANKRFAESVFVIEHIFDRESDERTKMTLFTARNNNHFDLLLTSPRHSETLDRKVNSPVTLL